MAADPYATLPGALTSREIRIRVVQNGMRTRSLVAVMTLLDSQQVAAASSFLLPVETAVSYTVKSMRAADHRVVMRPWNAGRIIGSSGHDHACRL